MDGIGKISLKKETPYSSATLLKRLSASMIDPKNEQNDAAVLSILKKRKSERSDSEKLIAEKSEDKDNHLVRVVDALKKVVNNIKQTSQELQKENLQENEKSVLTDRIDGLKKEYSGIINSKTFAQLMKVVEHVKSAMEYQSTREDFDPKRTTQIFMPNSDYLGTRFLGLVKSNNYDAIKNIGSALNSFLDVGREGKNGEPPAINDLENNPNTLGDILGAVATIENTLNSSAGLSEEEMIEIQNNKAEPVLIAGMMAKSLSNAENSEEELQKNVIEDLETDSNKKLSKEKDNNNKPIDEIYYLKAGVSSNNSEKNILIVA